jgi:eukaryotic-like serine/threonine-protein kinase
MTPEEWQRVRGVVEQVLDSPPEQREAVIEQACSDDASLRREVEALLGSDDDAVSMFLEAPLSAGALSACLDEIPSLSGVQAEQVFAERFLLVRRIGEGGMGQVWLAEQTTPVRRQVALKLIRAGMYDEAVVQRFQAERQSLAVMDHPAIAKIFDAGITPQGQPFFVMEYVPGLPITEYCDQKKLPIVERLHLFIRVCEGVQHAHQKAIIHRDLKPANILVVEIDGKPVPRIIDFGLAKAVSGQGDGENSFTQVGHFVGTPGYMSPEQADTDGSGIDTRTDVYSLGVVLYILLTGVRPLDAKPGEKVPLDELLRRLRQDDPPNPSTRISSGRGTTSLTAESRSTSPRQLISLLRGDLDWITLKALEKDRERRYATPLDLAADVQRFLDHRPVEARPASTSDRVRKYVRRHRVGLAATAIIAAVLVVAAVVSIREGIRANREAAIAEAVNNFLQNDLLAQAGASFQSGPNTKPDPDLKVRAALDRAATRIEGKFANQPEVEAAIRDTIGWTYLDLGLYPEARKQLERALELRRRVLGANDPKTLRTMSRLGVVAYSQGKYGETEALENHALEAQRRILGPADPDTLNSMANLADLYESEGLENDDEGKFQQAEALYTQVSDIRRRVLGPENPDTLSSISSLARVYTSDYKYSEAEALLTPTLEIEKRVLGPEHPSTLMCMDYLGYVYRERGKYLQAEAILTQTWEIRKRVLGPEHPDTAITLYNLGAAAAQRGDRDRAIALLNQSVDHGLYPPDDLNLEKDADLQSLHGDPRFTALVAHAKQVAAAKDKAGTGSSQ